MKMNAQMAPKGSQLDLWLTAWFNAFIKDMYQNMEDHADTRDISDLLVAAEEANKSSDESWIKDIDALDLRENNVNIVVARRLAKIWNLPLTTPGMALMLLGCNNITEVIMNVAIAKKMYELQPVVLRTSANAKFMAPIFGTGCFSKSFYAKMWNLQMVNVPAGERALLDLVDTESFR